MNRNPRDVHYRYALLNALDLIKILDKHHSIWTADDAETIMGVRCSAENALAMLPVSDDSDSCCKEGGDCS